MKHCTNRPNCQPLAQFCANWAENLDYSLLPEAVVGVCKKALLDVTAVGIAGFNTRVSQSAQALAPRFFAEQQPSVSLFNGEKRDYKQAAYCNTVAAHALDMDDTSYAGIVHATVVIAPILIAYAQASNKSGKELLTAFAVGSEIAYGLGTAVGSTLYENDFWPTGVLGVIGAAAALAKLQQLDERVITRAIAFAALNASPFRCMQGTDAKPLVAGEVVKRAIDAVEIAQTDVSIPLDVMERHEGPFKVTTGGRFDQSQALQLGAYWRLLDPGLAIKLFPLCSCAQTSVEALMHLMASNHLTKTDIESVSVQTTTMVVKTLRFDQPQEENQAMFSLTYPLACAWIDGTVTPNHIQLDSINRPDLHCAMEKISYSANDALFDLNLTPEAAIVSIRTNQGKVIKHTCLYPTGDPRAPATQSQFENKIKTCLGDKINVDKFIKAFENIETLENVTDLSNHFKGK